MAVATHKIENVNPPAFVVPSRLKTVSAIFMFIGLLAFVVGLLRSDDRAWHAFLTSFMYFTNLALGGLFFAAIQHVASAGWSDRNDDGIVENAQGESFPTVDILYSTASPRYQNLALAMRDMFKRELRVAAECRGKDSKLYKEDLKKGNFMIARGGWYGDYGDPTTWLDLQKSGNGNNDRGYSNPKLDAMLEDAARTSDAAERLKKLAACEQWLFTEEMPLIPLCTYVTVYMYDPSRITGMSEHPRLEQDLSILERRDQSIGARSSTSTEPQR